MAAWATLEMVLSGVLDYDASKGRYYDFVVNTSIKWKKESDVDWYCEHLDEDELLRGFCPFCIMEDLYDMSKYELDMSDLSDLEKKHVRAYGRLDSMRWVEMREIRPKSEFGKMLYGLYVEGFEREEKLQKDSNVFS